MTVGSNRAPVMIDGRVIGYISLSWSEEPPIGEGLPPSVGLATGIAPPTVRQPRISISRFSRSPGAHATPSHGNQQQQHSRLGHPHSAEPHHDEGEHKPEHKRFLLPEHRGNQERREQQHKVSLPKERPGKPIKVPHGDVAFGGPPEEKFRIPRSDAAFCGLLGESTFAIVPRGGVIDRSRHRKYLEIRDKLLAVMAGEQGMNALGTQAIAEETMNRADVRGQDLGETSKIYGRERGGYSAGYKPGALNNPKWRAILEDSLEKALQGSNVNNWATDNSSGGLAAKEARGGEFTSTGDPITGEYFWTRNSERAKHAAWKERQLSRDPSGNPAESTLNAPRPDGPAAPASSAGTATYTPPPANHPHVVAINKAHQLNLDALEKQKNRDAVEKARHFSNEPLTPEKHSTNATEPPHGSPL